MRTQNKFLKKKIIQIKTNYTEIMNLNMKKNSEEFKSS